MGRASAALLILALAAAPASAQEPSSTFRAARWEQPLFALREWAADCTGVTIGVGLMGAAAGGVVGGLLGRLVHRR
ncbi:MAG: hypothetical protein ACREOQ_12040 [Gemmatimonadales bacterium]